jgi:hypothetical protein
VTRGVDAKMLDVARIDRRDPARAHSSRIQMSVDDAENPHWNLLSTIGL